MRYNLATDGFHGSTQTPLVAPATALEIIFDEGTDDGPGFAILDNIDVNGLLITNSSGTTIP